jgi:hypothetical protein
MKNQHDFGGDYARDGGWSGAGGADTYTREPRDSEETQEWSGAGRGGDIVRQPDAPRATPPQDQREGVRKDIVSERHIGKASE